MIWNYKKRKLQTNNIGLREAVCSTSASLLLLLFIASRGYINAKKGTINVRKTN